MAQLPALAEARVLPLLHQIAYAVERLVETGRPTTLDLHGLPMGPAERDLLEELLGPGEVQATLSIGGRSEVRETGFPGVWWVVHRDPDDAVVGRFVEIAHVPDILKAQAADVRDGLPRLRAVLAEAREALGPRERRPEPGRT